MTSPASEQAKARYHSDPEYRARVIDGVRRYKKRRVLTPEQHAHMRAKQAEYWARYAAERRARDPEWRPRNKTPRATLTEEERAAQARAQVEYVRRRRLIAIDALGGKCAHCGNEDERVLQIDHTNGDRNGKRGTAVDEVLRGQKDHLQLLCANCHVIKTRVNGDYLRRDLRSGAAT